MRWLLKAKILHVGSTQALGAIRSLGHTHLQLPEEDFKHGSLQIHL